MASTSQSLRYIGPPAPGAGGGSLDALNRILADLCTHGNPKEGASLALRKHIEEQARDLGGEAFSRFMDQLYDRISGLLESNDAAENLGALRAIDELIDVALGENASKVSKFSNYMRTVFEVKRDREILVLASKVLGHLARAGGAMTADEVEFQVKMALDWLRGDRVEYRRFAAVLILKEMAENASTVFNVHVAEFVDAIWVALRDPTLAVRERAVEALRACLRVIEKRETRWRVQWYYRMFEATQDGLGRNAPVHSIHGSLLAVGELLRNTGEFMMSRYREVAEIVLRYLEHRDRLVRLSITSLLPRIAHFLRDRFVTNYLKICMNHILTVLRIPAERDSGFIALGEMAGALDGELFHYLPTITSHLREAIAPRRGKPSLEALACVGNIARAMGPVMEPHVRGLLDIMFSAGLSTTLVDALEQITVSIPSLLPTIQDRLLDCISFVLSKSHYSQARPAATAIRGNVMNIPQQVSDLNGSALVQLALQTLARFNFKGHDLLEFARDSVVLYLDDEDKATRKDAALCCCKLVANSFSGVSFTQFGASRSNRTGGKRRRLIEELVEKLLIAAVADADVTVRHSIFSSLYGNRGFDDFLAQADCLSAIFAALNDEALVARLLEGTGVNANNGIISGVLVTVGDLARVGGFGMRQYISELMPLIVEALLDGAAVTKREVAVSTLGQVVQSTGYVFLEGFLVYGLNGFSVYGLGRYVITPYNEYPQLLGLLLKMLNGELVWSTRREVLKVLGIMGALDPHAHKRNQQLSGSHGEVTRAASDSGQHIQPMDEFPMDLWPSFATSEDYYSTVAINSLMRILRDPSLASYHQKVVGSLMFIFKVLPDLFHTVRTCDDYLKDYITWKLGTLVSIVRQHIRKYLQELFSLISELWSSFSIPATNRTYRGLPVLHLVEQLCLALNDEFRTHLPVILPCCIQVLSDAERCNDYTYVLDILHTLEVFGGTLDEHMHLLLPALIRLFKVDAPVDIRRAAIKTLTRLIPRVQVTGHISSLVHHLKLVLDGKNDELRKDAVDALCCLAHALGEDFTIFIPSIHKLLLKHRLRHKEFEEIEGRLRRREPLILGSTAAQQLSRRVPVEVISDPLNDVDSDPYEDGTDAQKQLRGHQHYKFLSECHFVLVLIHHSCLHHLIPDFDYIGIGIFIPNFSSFLGSVLQVNDVRLRTAGEASQRSTKEDWAEWMRHLSIELLKESPSPALRTCARLAQLQPFVGRELFAAGFVSCWSQLNATSQKHLVQSLEMAFSSPNIPPEILATLLNLAEFMEHDEKPLPIDIRLLGALAEKCRAFAKALHYKEMEFEGARSNRMDANPVAVVEALIHINNQLHQHEAAVGILTYAQKELDVQLKESWYEKLQRWDDALKAYTNKASQASNPHIVLEATLGPYQVFKKTVEISRGEPNLPSGRMRCLAALARWEELNNLCKEYWTPAEPAARLEMAPMAASAAWNMGEWDQMAEYVSRLDDGDETKLRGLGNTAANGDGSSNGTFFRAVLLVRRGKYDEAREYVERARKCLATELAALVLESYERAYSNMVRVQQLSELEEVIDYCTLPVGNPVAEGRRAIIRNMWTERIQGTKRNVEVWQALLAVRALVLPPTEDVETWLKFASLCRKSGRISQARSTLVKLLQYDPETSHENVRYHGPPQVMYAYLKYQWSLGEDLKRKEAFARLQTLAMELSSCPVIQSAASTSLTTATSTNVPLIARVYLKLGSWKRALPPGLDDESIPEIIAAYRNATQCATKWGKAWHSWALFNTAVMSHYTLRGLPSVASQFVVHAVTGYFHSIACAAHAKGVDDSLQDILRLLTLWFNHGATEEVQIALQKGFAHVNINTWLVVLPQIIARIHSNNRAVRELIQSLLVRIGQSHPQALMYPLLVACKSISNLRRAAAQEVVDKVRQHSGVLVDQAQLVSNELIRVAILWHEMWHEALEEASRLYFGEHNIEGMLKVLEPLHEILEEGAMRENTTIKERAFIEAYRHELLEAYDCCMKYKRTGKDAELTQSVSPELLECRNLELAVPGTYRADSPVVTIASFATQLVVITSKQRPRKLTIHGSDGEDHAFLLKGHEDLRQDERVMQLFGLVNTLLENSRNTSEKDLSIQRYSVIPLSPNSGLIEWVPNCDTLHYLIREYRDARKITLNQEHKYMLSFAPDYDHLPLIAKVEVFEYALQNTEGNDLARVLWLKSRTSEIWLERRTNYTRSLAVMSMVGYLLGLGDRHPSNLMLHRYSGKILHIDFGDCFEASMNREKFPEKVPFRLTRMLVKAMEVSGIEGNFRSTCENVMQVLRSNRDSVMAMMEAFVHDPLINWRLFNFNEVPQMSVFANTHVPPVVNAEETAPNRELPQPQRGARERELLQAVNQLGDASEVLNGRAVVVMARMSNKLTGRDFSSTPLPTSSIQQAVDHSTLISGDSREVDHGLSVKLQVQKLIIQATSHENLCQNYVGWCPFW
ncbi:serine/threonine-protein kinase TOR [Citrus sinensis]|nr:serine/threonine-protein kinase TOR [Citrus sinensis]